MIVEPDFGDICNFYTGSTYTVSNFSSHDEVCDPRQVLARATWVADKGSGATSPMVSCMPTTCYSAAPDLSRTLLIFLENLNQIH